MLHRTFHIQTFGCQMNANDSDWLSRALTGRGFSAVGFEEASIHILNTCSVRDKPEQKVYSELGRIAHYAKVHERGDIIVCVGGCVAQQIGPKLRKRFPQVRLVFGTDGIAQAPDRIERLAEDPQQAFDLVDFAEEYEERQSVWANSAAVAEKALEAPAAAFVNIMQGCNNFCTYCIVPYVRGRQKSRAPEAVLEECRALIAAGARDITLLGQNVNSYGLDEEPHSVSTDTTFTELMRHVAASPGLERLRFVTPHPKDIAPEVIEAFGSLDVLCPRLHLPLQSGSDRILRAMSRRYSVEQYMELVQKLTQARPGIIFTTDIIVGFPGETEEDFAATLRVMREVGFASSFSFVYSDRPGAKAVLLPGKVERKVALERLARLQDWQNSTSVELLESRVGSESVVLIEARSQRAPLPDNGVPVDQAVPVLLESGWESWQGKTPEGLIVNVPLPPYPHDARNKGVLDCHSAQERAGQRSWKGAMVPVTIEAAARHSLKGLLAGEPW